MKTAARNTDRWQKLTQKEDFVMILITRSKIVNELMQESVTYHSRVATENTKESLSKQQDTRAQTVREESNKP